jgi:hypothetical protein
MKLAQQSVVWYSEGHKILGLAHSWGCEVGDWPLKNVGFLLEEILEPLILEIWWWRSGFKVGGMFFLSRGRRTSIELMTKKKTH